MPQTKNEKRKGALERLKKDLEVYQKTNPGLSDYWEKYTKSQISILEKKLGIQ